MEKKTKVSKTQNSDVLCPVIFEGREYFGIYEFDCIRVGLFTEKTLRGTFFTCIPISSAKFRKTNPTEAKVYIKKQKDWTIFNIYSDWGELSVMKIRNCLSKEIDFAKQKAVEYGILKNA